MARRVFSKEFKLEAVKRVREQGITAAQARRDLGVHEMLMPSNYAPPGLEHALHELLAKRHRFSVGNPLLLRTPCFQPSADK